MYDQILTKNPARPGGREREGKKEERGIARFNNVFGKKRNENPRYMFE